LPSGDSLKLLEPFKSAFPQYFEIIQPKKEEFIDIISAEEEFEQNLEDNL
jgi:hypothetical protein